MISKGKGQGMRERWAWPCKVISVVLEQHHILTVTDTQFSLAIKLGRTKYRPAPSESTLSQLRKSEQDQWVVSASESLVCYCTIQLCNISVLRNHKKVHRILLSFLKLHVTL